MSVMIKLVHVLRCVLKCVFVRPICLFDSRFLFSILYLNGLLLQLQFAIAIGDVAVAVVVFLLKSVTTIILICICG